MLMSELKDALTVARKAKGISREELAERTGLAKNTLGRALKNPEGSPMGRLHRICKELNVVLNVELGKE